MDWNVLAITLTASCFMNYVNAGNGPSCANQKEIDRINARVHDISNGLGPVMRNQSLTDAEKMPIIFNMACHDPYKTKLEEIEAQVEGCPGLLVATSSHLDDLKFFDTKFTDVLQDFENVADFCACRTLIPAAWTLKPNVQNLETTGPITKMFIPSALCSWSVDKKVSGVMHKAYELEMLITIIDNNNRECTKLPKATGFKGTTQMKKVAGYIMEKCPPAADLAMFKDKYECVVAKLDNAGARECFTNITLSTANTPDSAKCPQETFMRRKCVLKHAENCTEMGIEAYIYGVNLYEDKTWISSTDDCDSADIHDSATSVKTSIVLLFIAVLSYFL